MLGIKRCRSCGKHGRTDWCKACRAHAIGEALGSAYRANQLAESAIIAACLLIIAIASKIGNR